MQGKARLEGTVPPLTTDELRSHDPGKEKHDGHTDRQRLFPRMHQRQQQFGTTQHQ